MMKWHSYILLFAGLLALCCSNKRTKTSKEDSSLEAKAFSAYEAQDYERAIFYFDQLIRNDSVNGRYYYARGLAYGSSGKAQQGAEDFLSSARHGYMKSASYFNAGLLNTYANDSLALIFFKKSADLFDSSEQGLSKEVILMKYEECLIRLKE